MSARSAAADPSPPVGALSEPSAAELAPLAPLHPLLWHYLLDEEVLLAAFESPTASEATAILAYIAPRAAPTLSLANTPAQKARLRQTMHRHDNQINWLEGTHAAPHPNRPAVFELIKAIDHYTDNVFYYNNGHWWLQDSQLDLLVTRDTGGTPPSSNPTAQTHTHIRRAQARRLKSVHRELRARLGRAFFLAQLA